MLEQLYKLMDRGLKFKISENQLVIDVPHDLKEQEKEPIKNFIQANREAIIQLLSQNINNTGPILSVPLKMTDKIPLSFAQKQLWFIEQYEEGSSAYHIPIVLQLKPDTDLSALEQALRSVIARHEILHTFLKIDEQGHGYQEIIDMTACSLEIVSYSVNQQAELDALVSQQAKAVFSLGKEYPIRIAIIKTPDITYLSMVIHHVAFDGWSREIFLRDLNAYYDYYFEKSAHPETILSLSSLPIQYKDFAIWQRAVLTGERLSQPLIYWKNKLDGYENLNLPTDKPRPSQVNYSGASLRFIIDADTSNALRMLAKQLRVSLYSVLLSGFNLLLSEYSHQSDIVVGTPIANRINPQLTDVVGFFVNSLPLRSHIDKNATLVEYIKATGAGVMEAQIYQELPFELLIEALQVEKNTAFAPIFQAMFVLKHEENLLPVDRRFFSDYYRKTNYEVAKYDLTLLIEESDSELIGEFTYATSLFEQQTIQELIPTYQNLLVQLSQLIDSSSMKVSELSYLTQNQYEKTVILWNQTDKLYPTDKTLLELFKIQVEQHPDAIAVTFENQQLTYRELDEQSNQLARYIRKRYQEDTGNSLTPETLIGVCMWRSHEMIIAIMAILKSGGAYVPIAPTYPKERIQYILQDTKTSLLLTQKRLTSMLQDTIVSSVALLEVDVFAYKDQEEAELSNILHNNSLVYVIYTSGTTGNPKGVMIEQHALRNLVFAEQNLIGLSSSDKILEFASLSFDASVWEIFVCLLSGASLYLATTPVREDANLLVKKLQKEQITFATIPPPLLEVFPPSAVGSLKKIVVAGDSCKLEVMQVWSEGRDLINAYGPTEATVCATMHYFKRGDLNTIIGKPIPNTKVYVLNNELRPVLIGSIGELYVGGIGLARGYLNRPELNTERFIPNPFQTAGEKLLDQNGRLYKTGDLVRWRADGNLEYVGRNDFQVKIRGYRIELGEIEAKLTQYPGIKQAAVLAKAQGESSNKYLVGYYVANAPLNEDKLLSYLAESMPEYMVPTVLVWIEKLPLTVNGKLDTKALPEQTFKNLQNFVEPRHPIEFDLRSIFAQVLGLPVSNISTTDNFFRIGGDSIRSIQLVSRIRQHLNMHLTVKDIFNYKTISSLYNNVLSKQSNKEVIAPVIMSEQGCLIGELPLLPIQSWFFENVERGYFRVPHHWNQSFMIRVPSLDLTKLQASVEKLVRWHDSFRLQFKLNQHKYHQYYSSEEPIRINPLKTLNIQTLKAKEKSEEFITELNQVLTEWQSDFHLDLGNSYSIGYIDGYKDGSARIFFALHHLLVDAISWRILAHDLEKLYSEGEELGAKGTSYRQWVEAVKNYAGTHAEERVYWNEIMAHYNPKIFSNDLLQPHLSLTEFTLSVDETQQLLTKSHTMYNTEINDLLLTALGLALSDLTDFNAQYIMLEGHGREEIDPQIEITRTTGWFTTMYPVCLKVIPQDLGHSISQTKDSLRQIPNKGIGYGALLGYLIEAMPKIFFNYLGQLDSQSLSEQKDAWRLVMETKGVSISEKNISAEVLALNGWIISDQLHFNLKGHLLQEKLEQFSQFFKARLQAIIDYTSQAERSYLTLSDINNIIDQSYLDKLQKDKEVSHVYFANSLQEGFIIHQLQQGQIDDAYRVQSVFAYQNELEVMYLQQAWECALARYPGLRLRFAWEDGILVQVVDKKGTLDWRYIDLSTSDVAKDTVEKIIAKDRAEGYDLAQGKLLRIYLVKHMDKEYTCIISSHHAILDGWSGSQLRNFVHEVYLKLKYGEQLDSIDYLTEETAYLISQKFLQEHKNQDKSYWDAELQILEGQADLSGLLKIEKQNIQLNEYRYIESPAEVTEVINGELYEKLKHLAQRFGVTMNAVLQYSWHKLLSVYGNTETTVVGMTLSGRNLPVDGIEESVGLYINTLPLIVDHKVTENVEEILNQIQAKISDIATHGNVNLADIRNGEARLFSSLFVYESYPVKILAGNMEIHLEYQYTIEKMDYPLALIINESSSGLAIKLKYAGELFENSTVKELQSFLRNLLDEISTPEIKYSEQINYLNKKTYKYMINDWNKTVVLYSGDSLQDMFEVQVLKTPKNIAVICEDRELSYEDLNEKSNRLAHYLRHTYEIKGNGLIALCLDRSEHMLVAILGILKSGGAYVPMDPEYPDDRIKYILSDTKAKVVLSNKIHQEKLLNLVSMNPSELTTIPAIEAIDSLSFEALLNAQTLTPICYKSHDQDLAYVIYTSGTTGKPKGVMVSRENFSYFLKSMLVYLSKPAYDCLSLTNYVFDIFGLEYALPLLSGGQIVLTTFRTFEHALKKHPHINLIQQTPSVWEQIVPYFSTLPINPDCLFLLGGESSSSHLIAKLHQYSKKIINMYGPTETTIWSTCYEFRSDNIDNSTTLKIGKPLPNQQVYIVDNVLRPLPVGAIGELYIGGVGVSLGYLNKPDLTVEKFIVNPFQTEIEKKQNKNNRLYKTGDLARWSSDGDIEYLGRNDFQIKIRGHRIELTEIEAILNQYPGVTQSAVLVKVSKHAEENRQESKYLVGYYVSEKPKNTDQLLSYLSTHLPVYMVPVALVWLEKLPLNFNGKLDRLQLPEPILSSSVQYVEPRSEQEAEVCKIWSEILELKNPVSIEDDFFKLGGNSILVLKAVYQMSRKLGVIIGISDIFTYRTIRHLFDYLNETKPKNDLEEWSV